MATISTTTTKCKQTIHETREQAQRIIIKRGRNCKTLIKSSFAVWLSVCLSVCRTVVHDLNFRFFSSTWRRSSVKSEVWIQVNFACLPACKLAFNLYCDWCSCCCCSQMNYGHMSILCTHMRENLFEINFVSYWPFMTMLPLLLLLPLPLLLLLLLLL